MSALIASAYIPIFVVIALGYTVRVTGLIPRQFWQGINVLNHRVLLPCFLFTVIIKADFSGDQPLQLASASALSTLTLLALAFLVTRLMRLSAAQSAGVCATAVQWNFVSTFAMTERLAGPEALTQSAIILAPALILATTATVSSFSIASSGIGKRTVKTVITDPLIIAGVSGLVLNPILPLILPDTFQRLLVPFEIIGSGSITVVLLAMGAGLNFAALKGKFKPLVTAAFLRTSAGTAIATAYVMVFGFSGTPAIALILTGAAPSAAFIYAVAADFNQEAELTAAMITLSVLFSAIATPIAAAIALSL